MVAWVFLECTMLAMTHLHRYTCDQVLDALLSLHSLLWPLGQWLLGQDVLVLFSFQSWKPIRSVAHPNRGDDE